MTESTLYVGQPGDRLEFEATITDRRAPHSKPYSVTRFKDFLGRELTNFGKAFDAFEVGETLEFTATVVRHDEWKGKTSTVINRPWNVRVATAKTQRTDNEEDNGTGSSRPAWRRGRLTKKKDEELVVNEISDELDRNPWGFAGTVPEKSKKEEKVVDLGQETEFSVTFKFDE